MTMNDNDDLFDDLESTGSEEVITPPAQDDDNFLLDDFSAQPDKSNDLVQKLLDVKGIKDSKISVLGEDGTESEVDFYSLSPEEQIDILTQSDLPAETPDLDDDEINLLNHIRSNNLTVSEFLKLYEQQIVEKLTPNTPQYSIDEYADNELFLLDLQQKYELTDDELAKELEKELTNPELFKKKVDKLRNEYKQLEDLEKQNQQAAYEAEQQQNYKTFVDTMVNVATKVEEYNGIQLDDSEKQETLTYLLELDQNGTSKFSQDLNNPEKLYEAAWYLRYGKEAFQAIENAYIAKIEEMKKQTTKDAPVVVRNSKSQISHINDII
jgi:hypothetical protein